MKRLFLAGLVAVVAFAAGACCGTQDCGEECPEASIKTGEGTDVDRKVDIVILPLPPNSVVVDGKEYTEPGEARRDFPDEGDFEIDVDGEVYELDALSPTDGRLEKVYVVVGSKYVIGVYSDVDVDVGVAATIGNCVTCPNGATVCGNNPRCPRTSGGTGGGE